MVFRHRIGIINDFKNSHAFVWYQDYGRRQELDASCTTGPRPRYQSPDDSIAVFVNYKMVGNFDNKALAKACLLDHIEAAPEECRKEFYRFLPTLLEAL